MLPARLRAELPAVLAGTAAVAVLAAGALSGGQLSALADRVWPILLFLALIALVAELLDIAGGFRVAARWVGRRGGGRTALLMTLFGLLCAGTTMLLSIDTTAVLLTPVGITLARQAGVGPVPFAFAALWLANTASLLLPISNLTNLLAVRHADLSAGELMALTWRPQLVLLLVTGAVLAVIFRSEITGRYRMPDDAPREDPWLLAACVVAVASVTGAILAGWPAWAGALLALVVLLAVLLVRAPSRIGAGELARTVPYGAVVLALGMFIVVAWLGTLLTGPGGSLAGQHLSPAALAGTGALSGNLVNNLPAYLLLEPLAADPRALTGLLVGVNAGALLTPWGSLATVLWLHICRRMGLNVSARQVLSCGLVLVPVALLATLPVL